MKRKKTTVRFKVAGKANSVNRAENVNDTEPTLSEKSVVKIKKNNTKTAESVQTNSRNYSHKSSIPKIVYDIAFITFMLPAILNLHAYMYKLGKFNFYGVPPDYIEVGYQDLLNLWTVPLIFLFILLLPFYPFFIPSQVLERLFARQEMNKKNRSGADWRSRLIKGGFVLLMSLASFALLYNLGTYWDFARSHLPLFSSFVFSIFLLWAQSFWITKRSASERLLKIVSVIFSVLMLLISTTAIAQELGKFHAEKKTKYEAICSPEKKWVRVGKTGDKIIAKEINEVTNKADKKTILVGANCNDVIIFEDVVYSEVEPES